MQPLTLCLCLGHRWHIPSSWEPEEAGLLALQWSRAQTLDLAGPGLNTYPLFLTAEPGKSLQPICASVFSSVGWAQGMCLLHLK